MARDKFDALTKVEDNYLVDKKLGKFFFFFWKFNLTIPNFKNSSLLNHSIIYSFIYSNSSMIGFHKSLTSKFVWDRSITNRLLLTRIKNIIYKITFTKYNIIHYIYNIICNIYKIINRSNSVEKRKGLSRKPYIEPRCLLSSSTISPFEVSPRLPFAYLCVKLSHRRFGFSARAASPFAIVISTCG